jgi:hypothetical protein
MSDASPMQEVRHKLTGEDTTTALSCLRKLQSSSLVAGLMFSVSLAELI